MRAVDKAYEVIRSGIAEGRYAGNARITEQEIVAAAGVSRTPVREAMRRLEAEGFLTVEPNQGAAVNAFSADDLDEIFEIRALLEPYAAARATPLITTEAIRELESLAERQHRESVQRRRGYLNRINELNSAFHGGLLEAAGNRRLKRNIESLSRAPIVTLTFRNYAPQDLVRSAQHHLEIVAALRARDAEWASSVMRTHILAARQIFVARPARDARAGND